MQTDEKAGASCSPAQENGGVFQLHSTTPEPASQDDLSTAFRRSCDELGLIHSSVPADGQWHRLDVAGDDKSGNGDGSVKLFPDGKGGIIWNHKTGEEKTFWASEPESYIDRQERKRRAEEARKQGQAEDRKRQSAAAEAALKVWTAATPADDEHPYLKRKAVRSHGLRTAGGNLVVPLFEGGKLISLQTISNDGFKRFFSGGKKRGGSFCIGDPEVGDTIAISEGYVTAATVHEATGLPVFVAFDCGNLEPVACLVKKEFPGKRFLICADDDHKTEGNPGLTKATAAAEAVGGVVVIPAFGSDRPEKATDFNDLAAASGQEAVKACIEEAMMGEPDEEADEAETSRPKPNTGGGEGQFISNERGVFHRPEGMDKNGDPLPDRWLCSPLSILAQTRDARNHAWGRLLEWCDGDGHTHRWSMGNDLLQTDGADVRRMLASRGLAISPNKRSRELMQVFLQTWPASKRARCVERTGWCGPAFVAPDRVFGEADELVVFQGESSIDHGWSTRGTLEAWQQGIGTWCRGNSRLVFAVSIALAGPLLDLTGGESGGFHFRGASSTGKSTSQLAAATVWGRPKEFMRSWRSTANALESIAAMSNDGILILDEIGQVDPRAAGEAAYMLANGSGKSRANRSGSARKAASWRLVCLSSGETGLAELMASAGHRVHAGQEVRLCDIEADAGSGLGLFEEIHGHAGPGQLAVVLKSASETAYGTLGPAFLEAVVAHRSNLSADLKEGIDAFAAENTPEGASGQVSRVARRFGLVATAGELAIGFGLLPWSEGEADRAAAACFRSWVAGFGTGQREDTAIVSQVRGFLEANGAARFQSMTADEKVRERVGFWRDVDGEREYLVLPEAFKTEVCKGLDPKRAARVLAAAGMLVPDGVGKMSISLNLPGLGKKSRAYVLRFNSIQK